ncbi:MAG TPA: PLD nuclease N-terminal domain-containing protein [Cryobacterium sp.]|nr:PLD nuclease N-terminal domain-containing protein [Cryobacterium sp.]
MVRLWFALGVVVVVLTVYTLVDCALLQRSRVRGLPRWVWIFVIVLIPVIGPVLWLLIGRGRATSGKVVRSFAPDDDIDFLKGLDRAKSDQERLRALEQELADLDAPDPRDLGPAGNAGPAGTTDTSGTTGASGQGASGGQAGQAGFEPKTEPGEGDLPGRRDA